MRALIATSSFGSPSGSDDRSPSSRRPLPPKSMPVSRSGKRPRTCAEGTMRSTPRSTRPAAISMHLTNEGLAASACSRPGRRRDRCTPGPARRPHRVTSLANPLALPIDAGGAPRSGPPVRGVSAGETPKVVGDEDESASCLDHRLLLRRHRDHLPMHRSHPPEHLRAGLRAHTGRRRVQRCRCRSPRRPARPPLHTVGAKPGIHRRRQPRCPTCPGRVPGVSQQRHRGGTGLAGGPSRRGPVGTRGGCGGRHAGWP